MSGRTLQSLIQRRVDHSRFSSNTTKLDSEIQTAIEDYAKGHAEGPQVLRLAAEWKGNEGEKQSVLDWLGVLMMMDGEDEPPRPSSQKKSEAAGPSFDHDELPPPMYDAMASVASTSGLSSVPSASTSYQNVAVNPAGRPDTVSDSPPNPWAFASQDEYVSFQPLQSSALPRRHVTRTNVPRPNLPQTPPSVTQASASLAPQGPSPVSLPMNLPASQSPLYAVVTPGAATLQNFSAASQPEIPTQQYPPANDPSPYPTNGPSSQAPVPQLSYSPQPPKPLSAAQMLYASARPGAPSASTQSASPIPPLNQSYTAGRPAVHHASTYPGFSSIPSHQPFVELFTVASQQPKPVPNALLYSTGNPPKPSEQPTLPEPPSHDTPSLYPMSAIASGGVPQHMANQTSLQLPPPPRPTSGMSTMSSMSNMSSMSAMSSVSALSYGSSQSGTVSPPPRPVSSISTFSSASPPPRPVSSVSTFSSVASPPPRPASQMSLPPARPPPQLPTISQGQVASAFDLPGPGSPTNQHGFNVPPRVNSAMSFASTASSASSIRPATVHHQTMASTATNNTLPPLPHHSNSLPPMHTPSQHHMPLHQYQPSSLVQTSLPSPPSHISQIHGAPRPPSQIIPGYVTSLQPQTQHLPQTQQLQGGSQQHYTFSTSASGISNTINVNNGVSAISPPRPGLGGPAVMQTGLPPRPPPQIPQQQGQSMGGQAGYGQAPPRPQQAQFAQPQPRPPQQQHATQQAVIQQQQQQQAQQALQAQMAQNHHIAQQFSQQQQHASHQQQLSHDQQNQTVYQFDLQLNYQPSNGSQPLLDPSGGPFVYQQQASGTIDYQGAADGLQYTQDPSTAPGYSGVGDGSAFTFGDSSDPSALPSYDPMAGMGMGTDDGSLLDVDGDAGGGGIFDSGFDFSGAIAGMSLGSDGDGLWGNAFDIQDSGLF